MREKACHVTEEEIEAFVLGDVEPEDAQALSLHLIDCESCRTTAVDYAGVRRALSALSPEEAIRWDAFDTPLGVLRIARTGQGVCRISWTDADTEAFLAALGERFPGRPLLRDPAALAEARQELLEYFAGERARFDLPLDLGPATDFEKRVLESVGRVPFGGVVPYAELARRIGRPTAARAVGNAVGRNPVPIVIPCHRVIRSDGTPGGYSGGGPEFKRRLLALENGAAA